MASEVCMDKSWTAGSPGSAKIQAKEEWAIGDCRLNAPPVFEDINSVSRVLTGLCQLSESVTSSTDFLMSVDGLRHSTSTGTKHHRKVIWVSIGGLW